tara:strand:+ start:390397 stop:391050 length:654 start_codon:yes stop_codon:yes gene_type:complete
MTDFSKSSEKKSRAGTAVRDRGKARVSDILETTRKFMVTRGLANLSTRKIAEELGISVGNLAYYFPSKDALLQAVIEHVIEGYDEELRNEFRRFPDDPRQRLETFLHYIVEDTRKPDVQGFFYQLWGYTTHNEQAAETSRKMYEHFCGQLLNLLGEVHTRKNEAELENMAYSMLACLEGLHVIYGTGNNERLKSLHFDDYILRQLTALAGLRDKPAR